MKDFVTPEIAEELNKLGFNEPCLASWNYYTNQINYNQGPSNFHSEDVIQLPTYSQIFRWFREKHNLMHKIWIGKFTDYIPFYGYDLVLITNLDYEIEDDGIPSDYKTYEEAELACLIRLIEIVKDKKP